MPFALYALRSKVRPAFALTRYGAAGLSTIDV